MLADPTLLRFATLPPPSRGSYTHTHTTPPRETRNPEFGLERARDGGMKEGGVGDGGFVRADQIDLKSLDEQLERHLSRAWTMEKRKEEAAASDRGKLALAPAHPQPLQHRRQRREDWEIDPAKLVVRGVIARGTFGTVHRGVYDCHDVAG